MRADHAFADRPTQARRPQVPSNRAVGRGRAYVLAPASAATTLDPAFPMTTLLIVLGVLLAVALILGLWVAGIYNTLVSLRNRFKNAFAQIDVQLKRRYDLIPNLVENAKAYLKHER